MEKVVRTKRFWTVLTTVPLLAGGLWAVPSQAALTSGSTHATHQAPLGASQARALSLNVNQRVIVVLKNQFTRTPATKGHVLARRHAEAVVQNPVLSELRMVKARALHSYTVINAISATVSAGERARLAANPAVARVIPDQIIHLAPVNTASLGARGNSPSSGRAPVAGTCSTNPNKPALEPQALSAIHADSSNPTDKTARSLGITGAGVTVAFIADALDTTIPDFQRNAAYASAGSPAGSPVIVDFKDFSGEGTSAGPTGGGEAFLDAGSIVAQGNSTYDISNYSALPLKKQCYIRVEGVAPGANLVALDIFGAEDAGYNSSFIQAIDYAVTDHVNVLNESLGSNPYPDDQASLDLIKQANDAAVAAGVTVTASSGDAGITNTIGAPSSDPHVISAGASTTYEVASQIGYGGFQFPAVTGYLNNNISSLSSSGFQQNGATISLVAPGESNWTECSLNTAQFSECTNLTGQPSAFQESGGTSESAPLTAGVAALVYQAYAKTHAGNFPSPALVKQILTSTADDISAPSDQQGSGLLDAYRAVLAAESYHAPVHAHTPNTLLESTPQFNVVGAGGSKQTLTEQLTNLGGSTDNVSVSSRTLGSYSTIKTATVNLSDTSSPHSVDYQGYSDNYGTVHFYVPRGVDRLNGSIAYHGASSDLSSRVRLVLVSPQGQAADYSLPQGVGNFGDAQVTNPSSGWWTAYIWSRGSGDGGTTGPVLFGASVASYVDFGHVSTSWVSIPAGATRNVTLSVRTPSSPGDVAGTLVVAAEDQAALAIPVTVRTLVRSGATSFGDVVTGGNGRSTYNGVTKYYQVNVPAGSPALNGSVTLADNPSNSLYVWLIDPSGQSQAYQSNSLITYDSSSNLTLVPSLGANVHVVDPAPGLWTVIVEFSPTVSGSALSEPFTVSLDQNAPSVTSSGVPSGDTITNGSTVVAQVTVTNTGTAPEEYFIDGRLNALTQYDLPSATASSTTVPLNYLQNVPLYWVPSQTTSLQATATTTGTDPIQFDLGAPTGDPDVASGVGLNVAASVSGSPLSAGFWDVAPTVVGPFGATGVAASEPVDTSLVATTQAFDFGVTSPTTGDLWQGAIGAPPVISPVYVLPGQSITIPVDITASGSPGQTVSGTLYLDDSSLWSVYQNLYPNANTVAAIPYSYTIG